MLFYCREVFRRRSPAVAVRAAAAVQQLAASQQRLTTLNKVEIRWKNDIFVGFVRFQKEVFYCREVFSRLRAAAAVQQLAASQQQPAAFNSK